jgi:Rod binding domain-containing protein
MDQTTLTTTLARLQAGAARPAGTAADSPANRESVRRIAQEFEALFLSEMLAPVFESVDTEGLFGGGQSEKIFRSMMVDEYGKSIAQAGGVGIADAVQREILKMQENQQ